MKKQLFTGLKLCALALLMFLAWRPVFAQAQNSEIALTVSRDLVRFAAPGDVHEIRVEVFSQTGEKLFDSDFVAGQTQDWRLKDLQGQTVENGLYAYTVTIKDKDGALRTQRGNVIVGRVTMEREIELTSGGIKFPDNTIQTTAANGGAAANGAKEASDGSNNVTEAATPITSITPGEGLAGGGTGGDITLGVATGGIQSKMLAEASVINTKLGRGAVEKQNLAARAVGKDQLERAAVTADHIDRGAVNKEKLAAGAVGREQLDRAAVTADHIDRGAVNKEKLAAGAVTGSHIALPLALNWAAAGIPTISASNSEGLGMAGSGAVTGMAGYSAGGDGVSGNSASGDGVSGSSASGDGVSGSSASGTGVSGSSASGTGVFGRNTNATRIGNRPGVYGQGAAEDGVWAVSSNANGLFASGGNFGAYVVGGGGGGVYAESSAGFAMQAAGNAKQSRNKGGWVKAMFRYTAAGNSCFRGDEGSPGQTANSCYGFARAVGSLGPGESIITFPFPVSDRFVVVTPQWGANFGVTVTIEFPAPNQVQVRTWTVASGTIGGWRLVDSAFTLVVF